MCYDCIECENSFNITRGYKVYNTTNGVDLKNITNG